jgi:hypothetical protein
VNVRGYHLNPGMPENQMQANLFYIIALQLKIMMTQELPPQNNQEIVSRETFILKL